MRYALAKEPDERIPSAEEFINILEGRTEAPVVAPSRSGRWAILVGLVALLVIALGVWAIAAILSSEDAETQRPTSETTTNETPPVDLTVATTGVDRALDAAEQGSERSPEESESDVDAGPEPNAEAAADVGGEDADQIAETDSPKPVETPAASKLRFMSDPAGATVFVGGKPIGSTPVTTTVRGNDPVRVRFTKIGYKSKTMVVKPKLARQTVSVVLKPGRIKLTP